MKKKRISYNRGDGIIEITIRDETGQKIDNFKMNLQDNIRQRRVSAIIYEKYGIDLSPKFFKEKEGFFDF